MNAGRENWIAIGTYLFIIDEIVDVHIQKGHLVITIDDKPNRWECSQIVIYFPGSDQNERAKTVFDEICVLKQASIINVPEDVTFSPNLFETFYQDKFHREVAYRVKYQTDHYKKRHKRKLQKALDEISRLKGLYEHGDVHPPIDSGLDQMASVKNTRRKKDA